MRAGVIGIGLIGGSIARGLGDAIVFDANEHSLKAAEAVGLTVAASIDEIANTVDVLVIAVPFGAFDQVLAEVVTASARREKPLLVTNVLSVMSTPSINEPNVHFVSGHPMAGTEHSGFEASDPKLFVGKTWVLAESNAVIEGLVEALGAEPVVVPAARHNEIVAQVSHLPHLIAAAEVLAVPSEDFYRLAASSFADSTRVAATLAELTAGMVEANRVEALAAIERFQAVLEQFADQLRAGESVRDLFARAKDLRDKNL